MDEFFWIIRKFYVDPNIKQFAWRVGLKCIATRDNFAHRKIYAACNLCILCKEQSESSQHLFLTY